MERDDLYRTALEISILASLIVKLAKRDLERRLDASGVPVGTIPFGVLRRLGYRDHTISELSHVMLLSPATLVPVVDALERNGLAKRGQDPTDRRRTPLSLTKRGAQLLARVPLGDGDDALSKALAALDGSQRRRLLALLRAVATHMSGGDGIVEEISSAVQSFSTIATENEVETRTRDAHQHPSTRRIEA